MMTSSSSSSTHLSTFELFARECLGTSWSDTAPISSDADIDRLVFDVLRGAIRACLVSNPATTATSAATNRVAFECLGGLFSALARAANTSDVRLRHGAARIDAARAAVESLAAIGLVYGFSSDEPSVEAPSLALLPALAIVPGFQHALHADFLPAVLARVDKSNDASVFGPLLLSATGAFRRQSLMGDFQPAMRALLALFKVPRALQHFVSLSNWRLNPTDSSVPADYKNGRIFETTTALAALFGLSALPDDRTVLTQAFEPIALASDVEIDAVTESLRESWYSSIAALTMCLKQVAMHHRQALLEWIGDVLSLNIARTHQREYVDSKRLTSDALMINLSAVLVRLALPVTRVAEKRNAIDLAYLSRRSVAVRVADDVTRIAVDRAGLGKWLARAPTMSGDEWRSLRVSQLADDSGAAAASAAAVKPDAAPTFVTEVVWAAIDCVHVGLLPVLSRFSDLTNAVREHQAIFARSRSGSHERMAEAEKQLRGSSALLHTCAVHLRDPVTLGELLELYGGVCEWLLHCAREQPRNAETGAPDVTVAWAALPEHVLTDMCTVISLINRLAPQLLSTQLPALHAVYSLLCELLDASNGYVTSPYLRAQFTDLMALLVPRQRLDDDLSYEAAARVALPRAEQWRDALLDDADLHARLPHGLMQLYIDIERTGRQSQFYDKFNIRYRLSQVLRYTWHQPRYEPAYARLVQQTDFFVRFVNHNLNDSIYLLDESFEKLQAIRTVEQMDQIAFQALTVQRQFELRSDHERNVGNVQAFLRLANESVAMLHYMALRQSDAFLRTDLVQRLATMLNYWLVKLVGPECQNLKVRAPLGGFEPKRLLARVTDVLVLFGRSSRFVEELGDDGRSYTPELYQNAIHVLQRQSVGDPVALGELAARVEAAAQQSHFSEADLADAPDEFMDAIMSTLMRDPVRLPTCEHVVDRATITRHLLNDPHCPFTRASLTIEQLQPDPELRDRIRAYRLQKRAQLTSSAAGAFKELAASTDAMSPPPADE